MSFDANLIARKLVSGFTPYQAGKSADAVIREQNIPPEQIIKLGSNENPYGMSPRAAEAAKQAVAGSFHYPDNHSLTNTLAAHHNVKPEQIVLGNGSSEIIQMIANAFLEPGVEAVSSLYSFAMFSTFSYLAGATTRAAQDENFAHNLPVMRAMVTDKTRVLWIANPNNPTGTFIPHDQLKNFLTQLPDNLVVAIDEAYYDYLDPALRVDTIAWTAEHHNLIIIRTFSKIYGLAGLRIAYAVTSQAVASLLNRVHQPLNVNAPALAAAEAALGDQEFVQACYQKNKAGLEQLKAGFDNLELPSLPAFGNFITVKFPDVEKARSLNQTLLQNGIIVRPLDAYDMPSHLRVTVGTPEQNAKILELAGASLGVIFHHDSEKQM